jgi:hypothetical protein
MTEKINNHEIWTICHFCKKEYDMRMSHECLTHKIINIQDEKFMVQNKIHDLLHWYSDALKVAFLCRQAQKEYYRKQDQNTLRRAKALERRLDTILLQNIYNTEYELFR